jgi:hypothetical protein
VYKISSIEMKMRAGATAWEGIGLALSVAGCDKFEGVPISYLRLPITAAPANTAAL